MKKLILGAALLWASVTQAGTASTTVYLTTKDNQGASLGRVVFTDIGRVIVSSASDVAIQYDTVKIIHLVYNLDY